MRSWGVCPEAAAAGWAALAIAKLPAGGGHPLRGRGLNARTQALEEQSDRITQKHAATLMTKRSRRQRFLLWWHSYCLDFRELGGSLVSFFLCIMLYSLSPPFLNKHTVFYLFFLLVLHLLIY